MENKYIKEIILSGLFIALGIVLPMIFHMVGVGSVFLPMHIPVLIGGFVLSLPFAIAVGVITPILSSLITGMPPLFPVLPFMVFELATYGAMINLLYKKYNLNVYVSLILSMLAGRVVAGIVVWVLVTFFMVKLPNPIAFIGMAIGQGLPGIMIQIVLIPVIIRFLGKSNLVRREGIGI